MVNSIFQINTLNCITAIRICNLQGQLLLSQELTAGESINVTEYNAGTYIAKLQFDRGTLIKQIIKN